MDWKTLIPSEPTDEDLINVRKVLLEQLVKDFEALKADRLNDISECATIIPNLGTTWENRFRLSHWLMEAIFPTKTDNIAPYIQFRKLISRLRKVIRNRKSEAEAKKEQLEVEKIQKKLYCTLFRKEHDRDNLDVVVHPIPMPVTVAPYVELKPFFDFLTSGGYVSQDRDMIQFQRGTMYLDGRIDLCKQVVGPDWIGDLVASIRDNEHVEHFLLGNNICGNTGASIISASIPHLKIKTWYLAGNCIDADGIRDIAEALSSDEYCDALWLKRNPIKPEGAIHLSLMLARNQKLKTLDLTNTGILDIGCRAIFSNLIQNQCLRWLYLDANGITEESVDEIVRYYERLINQDRKGVVNLWIGINRLYDSGVVRLIDVLSRYRHMKRFCIGSNQLSSITAKACLLFKEHPKLVFLDLGMYKSTIDMGEQPNNIGDEGASYIATLLHTNKSIKVLNISCNGITNNGYQEIAKAMNENTTLQYLQFREYKKHIETDTRKHIEECLKRNGPADRSMRDLRHGNRIKFIDSVYRNKM